MVGALQNLNGSRDLTTLLHEWFVVRGLGLATINLPTKFEVSVFAHYEDIKGIQRDENWVVLGS